MGPTNRWIRNSSYHRQDWFSLPGIFIPDTDIVKVVDKLPKGNLDENWWAIPRSKIKRGRSVMMSALISRAVRILVLFMSCFFFFGQFYLKMFCRWLDFNTLEPGYLHTSNGRLRVLDLCFFFCLQAVRVVSLDLRHFRQCFRSCQFCCYFVFNVLFWVCFLF